MFILHFGHSGAHLYLYLGHHRGAKCILVTSSPAKSPDEGQWMVYAIYSIVIIAIVIIAIVFTLAFYRR